MNPVSPRRLAAPLLALVSLMFVPHAVAGDAWSPYHLGIGGAKLRVNYVHLTMEREPEFEEADRDWLRTAHEICRGGKEVARQLGKNPGPYQPLPAGGIPQTPWIEDVEIYYHAGQSVVVETSVTHQIDGRANGKQGDEKRIGDCKLLRTTRKDLHFMKGLGHCKVDISGGKVEYESLCAIAGSPSQAPTKLGYDPEALRRAELLLRGSPGARGPVSSEEVIGWTGESRIIANHRCEVAGTRRFREMCIATPESAFPHHFSHLNRNLAGILLQSATRDRTYTAREVVLGLEVGDQIFVIPKDGKRPHPLVSPLPRPLR